MAFGATFASTFLFYPNAERKKKKICWNDWIVTKLPFKPEKNPFIEIQQDLSGRETRYLHVSIDLIDRLFYNKSTAFGLVFVPFNLELTSSVKRDDCNAEIAAARENKTRKKTTV